MLQMQRTLLFVSQLKINHWILNENKYSSGSTSCVQFVHAR